MQVDNKESLQKMIDDYKNNESNQNEFNEVIDNLQESGFMPLNPIFKDGDSKSIESFVKRKLQRIKNGIGKSSALSKSSAVDTTDVESTVDIDLEDDVIHDPAFASLLNEDREIVIGNVFYKYTDFGLFYCETSKKEILMKYLYNLSDNDKVALVGVDRMDLSSCDAFPEVKKQINDGVSYFLPEIKSTCDIIDTPPISNGKSGFASKNSQVSDIPLLDITKQNFPIIAIKKTGFFEKIFGETQDNVTYLSDGRRVKVKFWNQNYLLFSSIGCKIKTQKRVKKVFVSYWEKTYVEKLEMGVNYLTYDYNFNVPAYNLAQYNYETTFFEYNGTKYNSSGKVINKIPTGLGTFNFDLSSAQTGLKIFILGYEVTNKNVNQILDISLKNMVNGIDNYFEREDLREKMKNGDVKFDIISAKPFSNKVTFAVSKLRWTKNNENNYSHYFDFNFLLKWKSSYDDPEDYLKGLVGAKKYSNVKIDFYGAAYSNGEWSGSRLVKE